MANHTIVTDIGTGSVKSVLFNERLQQIGSELCRYPPESECGGEIAPRVWWDAFAGSLRALSKQANLAQVACVILTGQMQNLIRLHTRGASAGDRSAILYYDTRGEAYLTALYERIARQRLTEITGNTPDGSGFPAKLLALADAAGGAEGGEASFDRILCGAHDYIAYRLTGALRTDRTTAGTTGLLDIGSGAWSREILDALEIDPSVLPEVCPADAEDGVVAGHVAGELGFGPSTRVIHGAGDVGASVLASELSSTRVACYLGTSGWVLDEAPPDRLGDPEAGVFNLPHPTDARVIRVAPLLTAAGAVDWLSSILTSTPHEHAGLFASLGVTAADIADPTGIVFLPHLAGERSPFKDPAASGVFLGLRRDTDRPTLFKAVLEGVSFAVRSVLEPLASGRAATDELLLSGGGGTIPGWPQLLADITGLRVRVAADSRFAGGRGMLRLIDTGVSGAATESYAQPEDEPVMRPNDALHASYDAYYRVFVQVYPRLRELMHELSQLRIRTVKSP